MACRRRSVRRPGDDDNPAGEPDRTPAWPAPTPSSRRAQQDATRTRRQIANQLRSLLREYHPAALAVVEPWKHGLCRPEAHELLKPALTSAKAARLTGTQLRGALQAGRSGRLQRGIAVDNERLREVFGPTRLPPDRGYVPCAEQPQQSSIHG